MIDLSHHESADPSWLNAEESALLFGPSCSHIPVTLRRLKNARLLWLNRKVVSNDPNFGRMGGDIRRYERHLLSACAYAISSEANEDDVFGDETSVGYADRYGGPGIGLNGGSGRTAMVNGYLVKGIGRTPLVSALTPESHASGGAYLEESVRDVIFTEIAAAEFPCSAVPILAIVDTGFTQTFQESDGKKVEWRTLVIRPCFVRPAHFERATAFFSGNPREGRQDSERVRLFFEYAVAVFGKEELCKRYRALWPNWARQIAYSFVHRLPHGSNTISNVCLDGKLLDFGAMSALPSWANAATMLLPQPFAAQFNFLPGMMKSSGYFFGRYLDAQFGNSEGVAALADATQDIHCRTLVAEVLRLCGVSRARAQTAAYGPDLPHCWDTVVPVIDHFQKERIDMTETTPPLQIDWDLHKVWDDDPPSHLRWLRALLRRLLPENEYVLAARRCSLLSRTRAHLFREQAKRKIFAAIDGAARDERAERSRIEQFINEQVALGRRDHRLELDDAAAVGFAIGTDCSYVLFRETHGDRMFGIAESPGFITHTEAGGGWSQRLYLEECSATSIRFSSTDVALFEGAVVIY